MENDIEREILLHAIDVLTMDVLRLKSENETLRSSLDQTKLPKEVGDLAMKIFCPRDWLIYEEKGL